jgi:hypothetical protein
MTRSLSILSCAAFALLTATFPAGAMEVFINTNAPAKSSKANELYNRDEWKQAADAVDGIWFVGQGMLKPPDEKNVSKERDKWIEALNKKQWVVEMKQEPAAGMAKGKHTVSEVKAMKDGGVRKFAAMVWDESHNKDSTITASEVAAVREGFKAAGEADARLLVNTRSFHHNELLQKLVKDDKVDGFSIEFASHPIREGRILESEIGAAIQFAVKEKKDIYLLINAEHTAQLLEDIRDIFDRLTRSAGPAMKSPHVRFVISSYSNGKIRFTPDHTKDGFANTVTGAALWLCMEADKRGLRGK